ncbi:Flagellar hook-associated protein FlgK [Marinobacterium lacunae]|uniref:Flagellar hook-associated protein 1 n=1 Tax=Marinobacterium lacunae TaxID=1232683 RepID=A0A081G0L7_9GAMM|nr:flagellar hook-associated protein FlgK [Marinobacterium lacunae]KEA64322.1 Flagellar hook-associated protein FlgK [Marinobacterium lacunae]
MSTSNLLNIGSQALTANTIALNVVGQNIANVDTDGYTRQDVTMVSREGVNGVLITDINRIADEFLQKQIYSQTSSYYGLSAYEELASQLDNLLASDSTSISSALDDYFAALQTALDDPSSLSNRELLLSETQALVNTFTTLDTQLASQNDAVNTELSEGVAAVNSLSSNLAAVNDSIRLAQAAGSVSNELLDQRDQILEQLAGYINFTTDLQSDGQANVFVGQGEPLVIGQTAYKLSAETNPDDATELNIYLNIGGQKSDLTTFVSGGVLGGVVDYRETVLNQTRDELGLLSLSFADSMNQLQSLGLDLDGEFGGLMFTDINSSSAVSNRLTSNSENSTRILDNSVYLMDMSAVQGTEYTLEYDSRTQVTLERADGESWTYKEANSQASASDVDEDGEFYFNSADGVLVVRQDGMRIEIEISTTQSPVGDRFTIQPTRYGVDNMDLLITDGSKLAFAEPISVSASANNQSDATLDISVESDEFRSAISALTGTAEDAVLPLTVSFTDDGSGNLLYTIEDASGVAIKSDELYVAGDPLLGSADGLDLVIEADGSPEAGDSFTLSFNSSGVSDNRNALSMAELQYSKLVDGASYQDYYAVMVQSVGSLTAIAQTNSDAAKSLLDANINQRSSVSGVSLDEEAANLVKFQQAYSAASQLISTWQEMFDTLLSSVRT